MRGIFALAALCLFALSSAAAAEEPKPLFAASDPIHITLQGGLPTLIHNRSSAGVPATLTDPAGNALPVALTVRGITRRASDVCDFPPLRVEFTTPPPPTSPFAGQKKLKLVTHCKNSPAFQQYVLLEYSAYKMYNILTPHSFLVRLADVDYRDPSGREIISRVGYFMEDLSDVAKRNGLQQTHAPNLIPASDLSSPDAARYALFQDMIANHDWSMRAGPAGKACCHNAELIGPLAPGATIVIPYDFDFSGFVDAPYATPPDQLHISSVRERAYRGYCANNADVLTVARQMREARPQMMAAVTSTPGMDPQRASRAISYLDGFFADIASDETVTAKLLRRCVG